MLIRASSTPLYMPGWLLGPAMRLNVTPKPCNNGWRSSAFRAVVQSLE